MYPSKAILLVLAILTLLSGFAGGRLIQEEDAKFFDQTGHWVKGSFLEYYNQTPNAYLVLGYPIREAEPHSIKTGVTIQYFQRARMEYDPGAPEGQKITLAKLGEWLYDSTKPNDLAGFAKSAGACTRFPDTGIDVCYSFRDFYNRYQGNIYFGNPISEVLIQDGRPVQYFERARMEWRPEEPLGDRVALTDIGRLHSDIAVGNIPDVIDDDNIILYQPIRLQVYAFPDRPLITSGDRQAIYVIVRNQFYKPIQGAQVSLTLHLPDDTIENIGSPAQTNEDGFVRIGFPMKELLPNTTVKVFAKVTVTNGPEGTAESMFRIWW